MKLYFAPGACSLASHIALHEAGVDFERVKVDLKAKRTEDGRDYATVNPKGYVPLLVLDDGEPLTENVAILDWIATRHPPLGLGDGMARTRLIEMLAFISTEIHKQFAPIFGGGSDDQKKAAFDKIGKRLAYLAERLRSDFLLGDRMTTADAYLYVMLRWVTGTGGPALPEPLQRYKARLDQRPAVKLALEHEGLSGKP